MTFFSFFSSRFTQSDKENPTNNPQPNADMNGMSEVKAVVYASKEFMPKDKEI